MRAHDADQVVDLGGRAIQLADQQRLGVARVAGAAEILGRVDGRVVHHLEPARDDAGGDDRGDALAALVDGREAHEHGARGLGLLQDADGDLGDDAEQAFRAGHQAEQVVAVGIQVLAAEADHVAIGQDQLQAQHVVGGEAVFQAVHAARVLGDVAADGAGDLRGGVGRVVEAPVLDRLGDAEIGDAGLGGDGAVLVVDVEDPVELAQAQDDAIGERQGAAGEPGAGTARDDLDLLGVAEPQDGCHLLGGGRQDHGHGHGAVGGEPVALVGAQLLLGRDHAFAGHDLAQGRDDPVALGQDLGVRLGHLHGVAPC